MKRKPYSLIRDGEGYKTHDGYYIVEADWTHTSGTHDWKRTGWNVKRVTSQRVLNFRTIAEARSYLAELYKNTAEGGK
jgi:hypothetical protein